MSPPGDASGPARRRHRAGLAVLLSCPAVFWVVAYLVPVGAVVRAVATGAGGSSMPFGTRIVDVAVRTVAQATASTAVALVVGVPAAWCHARLEFRGRRVIWSLLAVPFVLPTVVVAAGFVAVAGRPSAPLGNLRGTWGLVIAAHVAVNLAIVVRTVGVAVAGVDPALEEAARLLGRGRARAVGATTLRIVGPAIGSAALVVWIFCVTSYGLVVLLGGGATTTVEVEIWYRSTQLLDLRGAGVLALGQLVAVAGVVALHQRLVARRIAGHHATAPPRRRRPSGFEHRIVTAAMAVELAAVVVPLGGLLARALDVDGRPGTAHFRGLLSRELQGPGVAGVDPVAAIGNSALFAVAACVIALAVGIPAAVLAARPGRTGRWVDAALMLPLGTSSITLGFGVILASARLPIDLRGSWWAVPLVEAAIAAPLVVRALVPVIVDLDRTLLDAAALLGAGPLRRLRDVVEPLVRGAVVVAAVLAFSVSVGEFGATTLLSRQDAPTVPVLIGQLLSRPGSANLGRAMALGVVLSLLTAGIFALVERVARGRAIEF